MDNLRMHARRLLAALWRHRSWWLGPLVIAALLLGVVWLLVPERPVSHFIYGQH